MNSANPKSDGHILHAHILKFGDPLRPVIGIGRPRAAQKDFKGQK